MVDYYHTGLQHLRGASQRQRLPVNGAGRGWVVSRPGAQLRPQEYAAAQWVLSQTYYVLPQLIANLNLWQNANPVDPAVRRLLHVYFKLPMPANNPPTFIENTAARNLLNAIGQGMTQIWAGIQGDPELQIVDAAVRGTVNGYVNPRLFENANVPMQGRIHLNFQVIRPNDASTFRFFIHEASHKFAHTADHNGGCYFIATNLVEAWEPMLALNPLAPVPWGPSTAALTAQQAITHADSYGCFAENYRTLRRVQPRAPWI